MAAYDLTDGRMLWRMTKRNRGLNQTLLSWDGQVLSSGASGARSYDAATGHVRWEHLTPEVTFDATQAAADERRFYVGSRELHVTALSNQSGAVVWDAALAGAEWGEIRRQTIAGIAVSGDTVYAAANRDLTPGKYETAVVVIALDRATGRELWRRQSAGTTTGTNAAPVVAGPLLVVGGARDGHTFALDRFTGEEVWRNDLYGYVWKAPALHGGRVYLGTQAARLYALDLATGRSAWERQLQGGSAYVAVCGDKLVVENSAIELFDLATGAQIGSKIRLAPGDFVSSGIAVSGNRAFFAGQQKLYAIRCD